MLGKDPSGSPHVYQTVALFAARGVLFYICRAYLIRSLYKLSSDTNPNLVHPSGDTPIDATPTTPRPPTRVGGASYFELGVLPQPGVARTHPRSGASEWLWGPTSVARTAFAICFSESCMLFLLVMCQAYDLMDTKSRYYNWRISLITLVALILIVIPVLQCLFVAYKPHKSGSSPSLPRQLALPLFFFSAYIIMLLRIPAIGNDSNTDLLTSALARLSVLGTVVLGTLSGFGAIATAWMFTDALGKKRWTEITKQDISNAEHSLTRVRNDLEIRTREAQNLELRDTKTTQNRTWGSRFLGAFSGESEMTSLRREIAGLQALEFEMSRELDQMRARQARMEFSKTLSGRIWNAGGWLFAFNLLALFLGVRSYPASATPLSDTCIPSSSPSTTCASSATTPPDLISGALGILVAVVPGIPLDRSQADQAARQISLLLIGGIVLSSIRVVLVGVGKASGILLIWIE
ncbi:G protein coupled receptor [Ceratobasidium sp. AG-Ba]|nr:G protein coupled receptor [Ceratobasidium sp. AG-Ba]